MDVVHELFQELRVQEVLAEAHNQMSGVSSAVTCCHLSHLVPHLVVNSC